MYSYDRTAAKPRVPYGMAETAAKKVLRGIRPRGRKTTIREIVKALAKDDVVMMWFHDIASNYGRISYENTRDLLGDALALWKDAWEINEYDEAWEDMSSDPELVKGLTQAVKAWKPSGTITLPRDYSEAALLVTRHRGLADLVRSLASGAARDEEAARKEAISVAEKVIQILK